MLLAHPGRPRQRAVKRLPLLKQAKRVIFLDTQYLLTVGLGGTKYAIAPIM